MAKVCVVCDKWTVSWNNRSHSNRATKRTYKPNLFTKNMDLGNGLKVRVKICSSCYKKLSAQWKI